MVVTLYFDGQTISNFVTNCQLSMSSKPLTVVTVIVRVNTISWQVLAKLSDGEPSK